MTSTDDHSVIELHGKIKKLFLWTKAMQSLISLETGPTKLAETLSLGGSYFNRRYTVNTLPIDVERFICLRFGFGPTDSELLDRPDSAWVLWETRSTSWRNGSAAEFEDWLSHLWQANKWTPRRLDHPILIDILSRIREDIPVIKPFRSNGVLDDAIQRDLISKAFDWVVRLSVNPRATGVPTPSHLMQVCGIVLENNGTVEQAVAALLHDAAEDYIGTLPEIGELFGDVVKKLVEECSDREKKISNKEQWYQRKVGYLRKVQVVSKEALLIIASDKVHNARAMYREDRSEGQRLWHQLGRTKEATIAYFTVAHSILRHRLPSPVVNELGVTVALLASTACDDEELAKCVARFSSESGARFMNEPSS